jgi:hypothetical protein
MKPGHLLVVVILLAVLVVVSCGKSNSKTKPKLTLESINLTVNPGDSLRALFKISNANGLNNGTFVAIRNRLNQTPLPAGDSVGLDTFINNLPNFQSSSGEIRFALEHDFLSQSTPLNQNDTLIYKFFALTTDSVSTDTISSKQIVIINH